MPNNLPDSLDNIVHFTQQMHKDQRYNDECQVLRYATHAQSTSDRRVQDIQDIQQIKDMILPLDNNTSDEYQ